MLNLIYYDDEAKMYDEDETAPYDLGHMVQILVAENIDDDQVSPEPIFV